MNEMIFVTSISVNHINKRRTEICVSNTNVWYLLIMKTPVDLAAFSSRCSKEESDVNRKAKKWSETQALLQKHIVPHFVASHPKVHLETVQCNAFCSQIS